MTEVFARAVTPRWTRRAALLTFLPAIALSAGAESVSDDLLLDRVRRALTADRDLGSHPLQVTVEKGVVTVSGYLRNEKQKKRVPKVVKSVKGVKDLRDRTEIRPGF